MIEHKVGPLAEDIAQKAYAYGGSYVAFVCRYSREDKDALLHELEMRFGDYPVGEKIDEKALLQNIMGGIGRKIRPEQVAVFFRETIAHSPLHLVEPFRFCERYVSLKS